MRNWIRVPRQTGKVSRQAHCDLPEEAIYEREAGRSGFFGPTAHFHHRHPPTAWIDFEGPLRPRAFDLAGLRQGAPSPFSAEPVLHNAHCRIRYWRLEKAMPALARNADGDELVFVHQGEGEFFCDYGHLRIIAGDYLVIPRGTLWRIEADQQMEMLLVEATNDSYQLPDRGLLGPQAFFDPAMLDTPELDEAFRAQSVEQPWTVEIKRQQQLSRVRFPHNPLDAVGWHGDLSVVRINWRHFRPVTSHRYHLPPSVHSTWVASRFVVCTFVPRPIESDPGALKVPFYHNNDDFDEVLFYHAGDFFSRDNIDAGMLTFHPCGFTHGPHPKAFRKAMESPRKETDEVAVMIDTRDPLDVSESVQKVENKDYVNSWRQD